MEILPINSRLDIVHEAHMSLGYPSGARLCELLRLRFFWNRMSHDCLAVAAASLTAQTERARFCRPRWLYPMERSAQPFRYYALDCFVQLSPAAPNGGTAVVIAIDLFMKRLEYMILPHLDLYYVTLFVHEYLVCRFGVPTCLRVDRGSEFCGELVRYCKTMGIRVSPIATQNLQANRIAKKMVGTIKAALGRCTSAAPEKKWWEVLPEVAWGIQTLPAKGMGLSPFILTMKQHPELGL